jgi:hypothetical protein
MHESRPVVQCGRMTAAKDSRTIFNIESEMSEWLDSLTKEELRSFADLQELDGNDQVELYVCICFLDCSKTDTTEY